MIGKHARNRFGSEGHKLIWDLQQYLLDGRTLSHETKMRWFQALAALSFADNAKQGGRDFVKSLGLRYKTGRRNGETEARVYRFEWLLLEGKTQEKAFEQLETEEAVSAETLRKECDEYQKLFPLDASSIKALAKIHKEQGSEPFDFTNLRLYLGVVSQLRQKGET